MARKSNSRSNSKSRWQPLLLVGGAAIVAVLAIFLVRAGSGGSESSPAEAAVAAENGAGADIKVLSGGRHTVYHSTADLPTTSSPRPDGQPTLVWFSATWCDFCERMEPFAHATASQFRDRMVFVEKSVDQDRNAAARYGVRGTPTFVLIDATGKEVARFGFQPTDAAFAAAITSALARLG